MPGAHSHILLLNISINSLAWAIWYICHSKNYSRFISWPFCCTYALISLLSGLGLYGLSPMHGIRIDAKLVCQWLPASEPAASTGRLLQTDSRLYITVPS